MTPSWITDEFDIVIGLEVHVQVRTATKMFCACPNRYGAAPNTLVCPVCLGYPGVLPTPNHEAIRKTLLAGMMCDCEIAAYSKFDRKSYFYPDMPKNYQISQFDLPFCIGGKLDLAGKGLDGEVSPRVAALTRIHLEEDVAKSTHLGDCTGIDFNRAGVPLMEVVGEPDLTTPDEAYCYLTALKQVMQYAGISDCDMEKGQTRCDVNISLKPKGSPELLPKTEIKNLNSFKAVHHSLSYEIERQAEVLDGGGELRQETRGWRDDRGETHVLRTKENADDYRYFPEPDLMPITVGADLLAEIREQMPEPPAAKRERFTEALGIPQYDATVLTQEKACADFFEACVAAGAPPKQASNWTMTELMRELAEAEKGFADCPVQPQQLAGLIELIEGGTISGRVAKGVFSEMFRTGRTAEELVKEQGLEQVSDSGAIDDLVQQAIAANPKPVQQYREGKASALNFLMGQVMRLSRGKANPKLVTEMLRAALDE